MPPASPPPPSHELVESKLIPCERCGAGVALLIFAPGATDPGRFEDYARKMYVQVQQLNVPTHPTVIVTQMAQDTCEPLIREIAPLDGLSAHRLKGLQPVGHPGLDMHEAGIPSGHNGAEPDGADPAQTEPIPGAMSGTMRVNQRRQLHPLHVVESQRHVVDALGDYILDIIQTQSLAPSSMQLQIWANGA